MALPIFAEGVTTPMRLVGMREVFHPSAGDSHSHWFYEFEPDMEQGALLAQQLNESRDQDDLELENLLGGYQRAAFSPFRLGCKNPTLALGVGKLYDVILVPREPIPVPELSENGLQRLLRHLFEPSENEDSDAGKIMTIVPLQDLEAAEYDLPPDIEGLPDLTHVDGGQWMNMTVVERLSVIAQARKDQK
jgi:hypothetical protein